MVNAPEEKFTVDVFPNPAKGNQLNINLPQLKETEKAHIAIQDVSGKVAFHIELNKSGTITHDLKPGLYFVRVRTNRVNTVKKVIIE